MFNDYFIEMRFCCRCVLGFVIRHSAKVYFRATSFPWILNIFSGPFNYFSALNFNLLAPAQASKKLPKLVVSVISDPARNIFGLFHLKFSFTVFDSLYNTGQQERMLPTYQGILFHVERNIINQRNPNVCFFDFCFPCVGLVVWMITGP